MDSSFIPHRRHFRKRMKERWDIAINDRLYDLLCDHLRSGNGILDNEKIRFSTKMVVRLSSNRSARVMHWEDKKIWVIYDKLHKTLVTALPEGIKEYSLMPSRIKKNPRTREKALAVKRLILAQIASEVDFVGPDSGKHYYTDPSKQYPRFCLLIEQKMFHPCMVWGEVAKRF